MDINLTLEDAQPINVSIENAQPINISLGEAVNIYNSDPSIESDKNFVYELTGQTNTVVTHNLDKFPSVTVMDSAGDEVKGEYQHVDNKRTRLLFSAGFSGRAIFN